MNYPDFRVTRSAGATWREARRFAGRLRRGDCVSLCGPMSAGKTLFVRGLAAGLGVGGAVSSPTFALMNRYPGRLALYHFDLYRIESLPEAETIGLEEYLHPDGVSAVEWADKFPGLITPPGWKVAIEVLGPRSRRITYSPLADASR